MSAMASCSLESSLLAYTIIFLRAGVNYTFFPVRLKNRFPISSSRDLIWFDTVDCAQFRYLAAWLKFKNAATAPTAEGIAVKTGPGSFR